MKKILIVILAAVVIIGAGVGIFLWQRKATRIEDVLPQGALFYVKFSDVDNNFPAIKSTAFWQSLQAVRWEYLLEKSALSPHQKGTLKSLGEKIAEPSTGTVLKEFFGQEFAFAFYPPAADPQEISILSDTDMYGFVRKMFSNVLLVTRTQGKGAFVDFLAQFLRYNTKLQPEAINVDGYTLHYVTLPDTGIRIGFVNIHGLLVIGIDERILEESVKTFRRAVPSLASDTHLRRSRERAMSSSEFDGYWNMAEISAYTDQYLTALIARMEQELLGRAVVHGDDPAEGSEGMRQNVESIKAWLAERTRLAAGLDVLGVSGRWDDMLSLKFDLYFDKDKVDPGKSATYSCPAAPNATLAFVPAEAIFYQWNNCLDLTASWGEIEQEVATARRGVEERTSPIDTIETVLDVRVKEDVLPALGDEMGGYLKGVRAGDLFPVPEFLFFIKVGDEAKAKALLTKLEGRFLEHVRKEDYNGIAVEYIASPAGGNVELAYCIMGQYMLFSLSRPVLKESIDIYQGRASSLAASDVFKSVHLAEYPRSRAVQFIRIDQATSALENVLAWAKTRQAGQAGQKEAFQRGSAQRLADVVKEVDSQKQELEETKKRIVALNDEIENLESQQVDAAMQRADLEQSQEKIQALEEGIADAQAQQKELENIRRDHERYLAGRQGREVIESDVLAPLLKSFTFFKAWGVRTTLENGAFESNVFLKVE